VTEREYIKKERMRIFLMKVGLEKTMRRDLKSYFAKQRRRIRSGEEPETIQPVLQKHYERIVRKLIHRNVKEEVRIDEGIRIFLENRANGRSNIIDKTTQEDYEDAIKEAKEVLAEEGNAAPTERELMITASGIFYRKGRGRITGIANTETQSTTEGLRRQITVKAHDELEDVMLTRDKERAEEIYKISGDYTTYKFKENIETGEVATLAAILALARKEWQTMGDILVRRPPKSSFNHVAANGQRVGIMEPFIVSGQLLMYPGDSSLGASKGNVINCRCLSLYL
jgi:hypothetical protein